MMALGVKSAICAIFNFEMPVRGYIKMKEKFPRNMDEVMKLQEELDEFGEKLRKGEENVECELSYANRVMLSRFIHLQY